MGAARKITGWPGVLAIAAAVALTSLPAGAATGIDQANTYQGGALHDGQTSEVVPPLLQVWNQPLGGPASYPLVVGGRVFVTAKTNPSAYGTQLLAFDLAHGTRLWTVDLGGTYWWSAPAYDSGRVYALNYNGTLAAFDPATGSRLWTSQLPGQSSFSSAPTAVGGRVYVGGAGSGGTVYAVDASTGSVLWTRPVANGDESSPAVAAGRVYVSYACQQAYAFDAATGAPIWHHSTGCSGGGGKTIAVNGNSLYVRDNVLGNVILDAASGNVTGTFNAGPIPAFDTTRAYLVNGATISARDLSSGTTTWSNAALGATSAPLVTGRYVYVGTSSGVDALDSGSGQVVWSAPISGGVPAPDEQNVSQPLTGLAAAGGYLLVPTTTSLLAFRQQPDFAVTAAPSALKLKPKARASASITVASQGGFAGSVGLTVSGVAGGAKAVLNPSTVSIDSTAAGNATLTVTAGTKAASFTLMVQACAQTLCHDTSVLVQIAK